MQTGTGLLPSPMCWDRILDPYSIIHLVHYLRHWTWIPFDIRMNYVDFLVINSQRTRIVNLSSKPLISTEITLAGDLSSFLFLDKKPEIAHHLVFGGPTREASSAHQVHILSQLYHASALPLKIAAFLCIIL